MQVVKTEISPTRVSLKITADASELEPIKNHTLEHFKDKVKVPGFREGTAPGVMLEKYVDQKALVDDFLEHALNSLYGRSIVQEDLRPVSPPKIEIKKMVPFSTLEFDAEFDVLGPIKLPDYKKIKLAKPSVAVKAGEVNEVIESLRRRDAERKPVKRAAKEGDEVIINFSGVDEKGEAVNGADGKDYPLQLGSKVFIPGFEDNLVGTKAGEEKSFKLTFPKDYSIKAMQNRKVTFTVKVNKVKEIELPKLDEAFISKISPFKKLDELKADVKKQLQEQKEREAMTTYQNELVNKIAEKTNLEIPESLVQEQITRAEEEEKQNLAYRGQTWQEHLKQEGITEEEHRERQRPFAEQSVKAGLVLSEVSQQEKISVTPEEVEIRIQILKGQYSDPQMQAELDKPEARQELEGRLRLEKTVDKLVEYASKK